MILFTRDCASWPVTTTLLTCVMLITFLDTSVTRISSPWCGGSSPLWIPRLSWWCLVTWTVDWPPERQQQWVSGWSQTRHCTWWEITPGTGSPSWAGAGTPGWTRRWGGSTGGTAGAGCWGTSRCSPTPRARELIRICCLDTCGECGHVMTVFSTTVTRAPGSPGQWAGQHSVSTPRITTSSEQLDQWSSCRCVQCSAGDSRTGNIAETGKMWYSCVSDW